MDWNAECKTWHDLAVAKRLAAPCSKGRTPFMLRVYPLNAPVCVIWKAEDGLGDRERQQLQIANENMRVSKPFAALIQSDAWFVHSDKFAERFGIRRELSFEDYQKAYLKVMRDQFDGSQANLPADLRSDAIFTHVKGPQIKESSMFAFYSCGDDDRFILEERPEMTSHYYGSFNLLNDWWPATIN